MRTFKEYTEGRISDLKIIGEIFPDMVLDIDFDVIRDAYEYEDHLIETKKAFEKLFGRKLTWEAVDSYNAMFNGYIKKTQYGDRRTHFFSKEDFVNYNTELVIDIRRKFCKLIGINEPDLNALGRALINHSSNHWESLKNDGFIKGEDSDVD